MQHMNMLPLITITVTQNLSAVYGLSNNNTNGTRTQFLFNNKYAVVLTCRPMLALTNPRPNLLTLGSMHATDPL